MLVPILYIIENSESVNIHEFSRYFNGVFTGSRGLRFFTHSHTHHHRTYSTFCIFCHQLNTPLHRLGCEPGTVGTHNLDWKGRILQEYLRNTYFRISIIKTNSYENYYIMVLGLHTPSPNPLKGLIELADTATWHTRFFLVLPFPFWSL